jgi:ATP-dependent DNA ligase
LSHVAEEARSLGLRLFSRRWDDPPHTVESMDAAIAELAALRRVAIDGEDLAALEEVLAEFADLRDRLES